MDLNKALAWAGRRRTAVLITLRRDGRPQSSDIAMAVSDGVVRISVTADRAKTHNMERDPRVVLHVTEPNEWSYASFDGTVELTPVTLAPDDDTAEELVEVYRQVSGEEHPDWDEFRATMIADRRLVVRFHPSSVTGRIP